MRYPNFSKEKTKLSSGYNIIIGCDEVGRGCLAGPVVAAAVALDPLKISELQGVKDSKLVTAEKRFALEPLIKEHSFGWAVGVVSHKMIDKFNIHRASLLAMQGAVTNLLQKLSIPKNRVFLYVDGRFKVPALPIEQEAVIDADLKIFSVSAASIVAKVYRDKLMIKQHERFPQYNFARHKGYATLEHRSNLQQFGPSKIHRVSFMKNLEFHV